MSWQDDITTAVLADESLSEMIGDKFFADIAAGNAKAPFIVYQAISEIGETTFDGSRTVTFPLVQFACWGRGKSEAVALAKALKNAIEGKELAGDSGTSLGFSGQSSMRDQQTKLFCEYVDYRISCKT